MKIFGGAGARVDRLGFVLRSSEGGESTVPPFGGGGGDAFNCGLPGAAVATGLVFRAGADLDAVGMLY